MGPVLNNGKLLWCGEHWINAIKTENDGGPSAWFSLFHTRYSKVGEGNTLHLRIPGRGIDVICTDNLPVGEWIAEAFLSKSSIPPSTATFTKASFQRDGDTHLHPSWIVQTDTHRIVAHWHVHDPPVIAYGSFREGTEHFTMLFFTDESGVEVDGISVEGRPYPRDIWKSSLGGMRSSSVFALAETLIESRS